MARSRNRNNQGSKRSEEVESTTDAEFLDNDDQVEVQLKEEEEQSTMAKEPLEDNNSKLDEASTKKAQTEPETLTQVETKKSSQQQEPESKPEVTKKKGNNAVWYGVAAVLVAAAVGGIYYSNQSDESGLASSSVNQSSSETSPTQEDSADAGGELPLAVTEGAEQPQDESYGTEIVDEEVTSDSEAELSAEDDSALASASDVVEHQAGVELDTDNVEESIDSTDSESSEVTSEEASMLADEAPEDEAIPAEQGPIVSPEIGIGAFEQEELARGERSPEEVNSTDEPNAEVVPSSEVQELNETELVVVPSEGESSAFTEGAVEPVDEATQEVVEQSSPNTEIIAQMEREFEVLAARQQQEIRRLQEELVGMQQHLQASSSNAENLLLNDVSRLLQSAENELRFNGNVANAVSILTVAQRISAESKNRMLEGLVGAIGADIVSLKSSEFATVDDMFRQVQQIALLVDAAPLITPDYASHNSLMTPAPVAAEEVQRSQEQQPSGTSAADAKWYERTWTQTKFFANKAYDAVASDLGELVRVEKLSEPDSGLLSTEQAGIMRNNLKMQLNFAQQALMSRQQGVWQTSLTTVAEAFERYFRSDAAETVKAQAMLAQLSKSSVQPAMPDISHSRRALAETYEQLRVQRSFEE